MKNKGAKIMAFLALFGIIISVLGTGLIIIFSDTRSTQVELTEEQIEQIQEMINSQSGSTSTGELTGTGEDIKLDDIIEIK